MTWFAGALLGIVFVWLTIKVFDRPKRCMICGDSAGYQSDSFCDKHFDQVVKPV